MARPFQTDLVKQQERNLGGWWLVVRCLSRCFGGGEGCAGAAHPGDWSALDRGENGLAQGGGAVGDGDPGGFHRLDLVVSAALATGDDGARMAHAAARRRGAPGDEARGGFPAALLALGGEEFGGVFLGGAADFADHDDRLGLVIVEEPFQHVDMLGPLDRVAADADAGGLAKAHIGGLLDRLVGERARARHDADLATLVDMAGHDADLAGVRRDDAGAVGADQLGVRGFQRALDAHHVQNRDTFGDADDHFHLGVDRLEDRVGGEGRRDIDHRRVRAGLVPGLVDRVEDRQVKMRLAALAGGHAADHLGAIGDRLFGVESALRAGEALTDHLGVFVDEDCHLGVLLWKFRERRAADARPGGQPLTAFTIFSAPSLRSSAPITSRPEDEMISLPFSTFVPSRRTTSGTLSPTSFTAAITPSAITSQRMIPPKMLTRMPLTCGSEVMILNASVTFSLVAPPPTSRKLAGSAP